MDKKLRVLFRPGSRAHVEIIKELSRSLEDIPGGFEARVINCDRYYCTGASEELERAGIKGYELPRPSGSCVPVWRQKHRSDTTRYFYLVMKTFDEALRQFRPHVFLLPYDAGAFEVGFIKQCARRNIPSLIVQEGLIITDKGIDPLINRIKRFKESRKAGLLGLSRIAGFLSQMAKYMLRRLFPRTFPPVVRPFGMNGANYIAAIGPLYYNLLIARGISGDRICVTGLPRFDGLWRIAQKHKRYYDSVCRFNHSKPRAIYLQSRGFHYGNSFDVIVRELEDMEKAAEQFGGSIDFIVRIRPEDIIAEYEPWWSERFRFIKHFPKHEDLYDVFLDCDFTIAGISTTSQIEAILMGLPCINYNPNQTDNYSFVSSGAVLPAYDSESLACAVKRILDEEGVLEGLAEGRKRFVEERILFDGQASRRVSEFILKIVGSWDYGTRF